MVETAADGIITIDERGIVRTMNPAAERIFGYASSEVAGHNVAMLMPRAHQAEHDSHIANYLRTGKSNIMGIGREVSGLRKDGAIFPLDIKVSETWLDKRRIFTGIVRDITERKEAEIKLQAQLSRLDLLHQITRAIGERQDLPSMFQVIVRSLEENLPIDFGCVCLYDPAEETLTADISAFATSSVPRSPTKSLLWDAPYRLPKVATSFLLSGIGPSFAPLRKVSPDARF